MNLYTKLRARQDDGNPIRVGLIGSGKFGSMFLAQLRHIPGMHLLGIADLSAERVRRALFSTGWDVESACTGSFEDALSSGRSCITEDPAELIEASGLDVVVEATGDPAAGIRHALLASENGRYIVMVNVEADVLAGPQLVKSFDSAGLVYSMAYGDQPALVCEMIDWARTCGFRVVAAGKGTKYPPAHASSTPDTAGTTTGLHRKRRKLAG